MPALVKWVDGLALLTGSCEAALEHFHESIMQGLDDTHSDMMSDLLVIWRGAITACDPKSSKCANVAKLLVKEKDRSQGHTNSNFRKVCAVVRGIPQLNSLVDDFQTISTARSSVCRRTRRQ